MHLNIMPERSNITLSFRERVKAERVKVTLNRELWIMIVSRREEGIRYQPGEIRVYGDGDRVH